MYFDNKFMLKSVEETVCGLNSYDNRYVQGIHKEKKKSSPTTDKIYFFCNPVFGVVVFGKG